MFTEASLGRPVVKTLNFHCRGRGFHPWSRNWDPMCCVVWPKKRKKEIYDIVQPSPQSISRTFSSSRPETLSPLNTNCSVPLPQPLATTTPLSVFMNLTALETSYKRRHTVFVLLWQAYMINILCSGSSMLYHMSEFLSFLRPGDIPWYV